MIELQIAAVVLAASSCGLSGALLWMLRRGAHRPHEARERRHARLGALASAAVSYASAMKGGSGDRLRHALEAFRLLDESDGKRDFTEAQARVAIEAALVQLKLTAPVLASVPAPAAPMTAVPSLSLPSLKAKTR